MSQFLGIIAVVGEDGTIKVPLDMLQTAGIQPNSKVELFSDTSNLFIRTAEKFCDICSVNTNTTRIGAQEICKDCLDRITKAAQEGRSAPAGS
ncbi:AbrB/MazE/SpoVT family DNA-binding domain-containing protein [Bacillus mobilis]|uniref:AbrB/MazE/SpoVT family DNA-binding domain-containing protein n=1 Tax=Bacillus mobilis TaxID=2026190 RepID=UPI0021D2954B|nr:AbrB/MazE/SpoVT family DNA-binding domain-containing protein [Bacillus mobilis]MCU5196504.1 AbrB/MazE/SpoVT family DNA-binding domain-containing protein [Bacillus mobilis]